MQKLDAQVKIFRDVVKQDTRVQIIFDTEVSFKKGDSILVSSRTNEVEKLEVNHTSDNSY